MYSCSSMDNMDILILQTCSIMAALWWYMYKLLSIDGSLWNVQKVSSIGLLYNSCSMVVNVLQSMYSCSSMDNMDILILQTCSIMAALWWYMYKLLSIDGSLWNVQKVSSIGLLYNSCSMVVYVLQSMYSCSSKDNMDILILKTYSIIDSLWWYWYILFSIDGSLWAVWIYKFYRPTL